MCESAGLVARLTGANPVLIQIVESSGTIEAGDNAYNTMCGSPALARKLINWEAGISLIEGLQRIFSDLN